MTGPGYLTGTGRGPSPTKERTVATIKLRHKWSEGYSFGDGAGAIQFGLKAGLEPGIAIVDEDHPLLERLMATGDVEIVRPNGGPVQVFICPIHADKEFSTRGGLINHFRSKGHEALLASVTAAPSTADDADADDAADAAAE